MKVILVRHGDANPASKDVERSLTELGVRQAQAAGKFIASLGICPDRVFSSDKARSVMTARIISEAIGYAPDRIISSPSFVPNAVPEAMGEEIALSGVERVIVVGHLPSLAHFTSFLITTPREGFANVSFETCQVVVLSGEKPDTPGGFILELSYPAGEDR